MIKNSFKMKYFTYSNLSKIITKKQDTKTKSKCCYLLVVFDVLAISYRVFLLNKNLLCRHPISGNIVLISDVVGLLFYRMV